MVIGKEYMPTNPLPQNNPKQCITLNHCVHREVVSSPFPKEASLRRWRPQKQNKTKNRKPKQKPNNNKKPTINQNKELSFPDPMDASTKTPLT